MSTNKDRPPPKYLEIPSLLLLFPTVSPIVWPPCVIKFFINTSLKWGIGRGDWMTWLYLPSVYFCVDLVRTHSRPLFSVLTLSRGLTFHECRIYSTSGPSEQGSSDKGCSWLSSPLTPTLDTTGLSCSNTLVQSPDQDPRGSWISNYYNYEYCILESNIVFPLHYSPCFTTFLKVLPREWRSPPEVLPWFSCNGNRVRMYTASGTLY